MKTLISIDPGMSTGVIIGTYSDDTPFELTHAFQIEGGVEGFVKRCYTDYIHVNGSTVSRFFLPIGGVTLGPDLTVLVEKFTARGAAAGPFALKTDALEPLRIEGALIAMGVPITWVQPPQQYILGGKDKAEKKKRQHAWLKENGYYIAPKDVNETPELAKKNKADDARSATAHAISWLRRQKHKPTLDYFRKEDDE